MMVMSTKSNWIFPVVPQPNCTISPVPQMAPHVSAGPVFPPITFVDVDFEPFAFHFWPVIEIFDLSVRVSPEPVNVAIVMRVMP